MRQTTRFALLIFLGFALTGCGIVYRLPTRQGNVLEQSDLDKLQIGMTKKQVTYILGTPIATSPFESSRWDYFGYYKSPRGNVSSRNVSLYFDRANTLTRMVGIGGTHVTVGPEAPDKKALAAEDKKANIEKSRAQSEAGRQSGVVLKPTPQTP